MTSHQNAKAQITCQMVKPQLRGGAQATPKYTKKLLSHEMWQFFAVKCEVPKRMNRFFYVFKSWVKDRISS